MKNQISPNTIVKVLPKPFQDYCDDFFRKLSPFTLPSFLPHL
jgi:hypothetical protein